MRNNNSGCLTALVAGFSRMVLLFMWIARPVQFQAAFSGSWLLPCLGFLFLPFTTMVYVWLQTSSAQALTGLEWILLGLCVVLDIFSAAHAGYSNRTMMPGYTGPTTPPTAAPPPSQPPSSTSGSN
jgi:putative effector of murein hydrolase LrgA (UPF0299 family)